MFQLVVAVTAIALMCALALAGIFAGGEAYQKAQERAAAASAGKPAAIQSAAPVSLPLVGSGRWVVTDSY